MAISYNNPVVVLKRVTATDVDAYNAVGVAAVANTTLYNGTLVTLGAMNTGTAAGMNYVFPVTPTTGATVKDVWMVRSPEVPMDVAGNLYIDPRAFSIASGRPADLVRLNPGVDYIQVTGSAFTEGSTPTTANNIVEADADGKFKAVNSATAGAGISFAFIGTELLPIGQEMVTTYILKCTANPVA